MKSFDRRMHYNARGKVTHRRRTKGGQRFFYDGYLQVANERTVSNEVVRRSFVWDPTEPVATRPLAWFGGDASLRLYAHDGNKNVSEVVAAASGTNATVGEDSDAELLAHYDYAAFGAVIAQRGGCAEANPWRFSSEYEDTELGLDYYNYRHYEPVTGRWLQRDPIGEAGGANLYGFCKNSPYLLVDAGGCSLADYMPFWSTILSMINNFLGHIPGSSPIDYPFVSPQECVCNGEAAEEACAIKVQDMALKYIADYAASAAVARGIDLIVAILSLHLNPGVAAAFFADGMIGIALNAKAAAKIMEGANKAKQNNCSCSQYEH